MKGSFKNYLAGGAIVLLSFLQSCAPTIPKGQEYKTEDYKKEDKNTYLNSIRHLTWEKKEKLVEEYYLMRILDPKGVFEEIRVLDPLDSAYDKPEIDSLVEKYKKDQDLIWAPHTPGIYERWDEIMKRLEHVKLHKYTTSALGVYFEKPAEFIIRLDLPDNQRTTDDEPCGVTGRPAAGIEKKCPKLYMTWGYTTVAFEPDEDGEYNTILHENTDKMEKGRMNPEQLTLQLEHKILKQKPTVAIYKDIEWIKKTGVDVSAFPNSFDTTLYTVYISTGMPSKELREKLSVGDSVYVKYKLVIYDHKDSAIVNDSLFLDPIPTSILKDGTWYRFYTNLLLPHPEKYTVAVAISSLDGKKLDVHRIPKNIPPSPSGMGDILISDKPPVIKDNIIMKQGGAWTPEGIWRPGGIIIPNYPFGLATGDTFYAYTEPEIKLDSDGKRRYKVEFSLFPTKGKRKGEVELGEAEYFFGEEEAKRIEKGFLEEEVKEIEIKGRIKLFSRDVETEENYFAAMFSIPPTVETGSYNLAATFKYKGSNNTIWKEIRIKQKK